MSVQGRRRVLSPRVARARPDGSRPLAALLLLVVLVACGKPPGAASPGAETPAPTPVVEAPASPADPAPASPADAEPWAGLPAPTLDALMVGSCSVDGTPGLVAADGELPPIGAELWLATATGVVPGVVSARGGCDDEELAAAEDPDSGVECPTPWAEVEVQTDDGELPCAGGWGREWPDVLVDVPLADVVVAVPRAFAPPRIPAQRRELHLLDGRCEGHEVDDAGEERVVTVSDREWPLAARLDALLPELAGAPRRVMTLAADGGPTLHAIAATLDDRAPKARARWALLRGAAPTDLELLTTREEPHPKRRLALEHLLDHTCRTPFMFAPTPALLLRLEAGAEAGALLLTADERPGETIRFELWSVDDAGAKLRHRYPSELFSPKF